MPFGPMEIIVIAGIALLIFGPKRLPELAKGLGKGMRDFKKALEGKDEPNSLPDQKNVTPDVAAEKPEEETEPRQK